MQNDSRLRPAGQAGAVPASLSAVAGRGAGEKPQAARTGRAAWKVDVV
jgi:hypothetical protein